MAEGFAQVARGGLLYEVTGSLLGILLAEQTAYAEAVTTVTRRAAVKMKNRGRAQMKRAGLGDRLPNALRDFTYPRQGESADAVGGIYSKAIVDRGGDGLDVIRVHEEGAAISARGGQFLAIPTERVGRKGGRLLRPGDYPRGFLHVEMQKHGKSGALVDDTGAAYFVLLPSVAVRAVLDLAKVREQVAATIDVDIVIEWERRSVRAGIQPTGYGKLKRSAALAIARGGATSGGSAGPGVRGSASGSRLNDNRARFARR